MLYTHALGHLLRHRRGARADPDLAESAKTDAGSCATPCSPSSARASCSSPGCRTSSTRPRTRAHRGRHAPRFGAPVLISRDLLGGDRDHGRAADSRRSIGLGAAVHPALPPQPRRRPRCGPLIALPVADAAGRLAGLADHSGVRLSLLRAGASPRSCCLRRWGAARAGIVGLVAIALSVVFVVHISSYFAAVQERHARHRRRDDAAAAPGRSVVVRAARADPACLVLPACRAADTRRRSGR